MGINKQKERIGEVNFNKYGSKMTIIKYNNAKDIEVEFENGYITNSAYKEFKNGVIRNPYDKSVYGYGYLGEGPYKTKLKNIKTPEYKTWHGMMERIYNEKTLEKYPTYKKCAICEDWHNFQNFAKWYSDNYYEIPGEKMELDKDILIKGNKLYSSKTCIFVPKRINLLFSKQKNQRGELPIGISRNYNKYKVACGQESLGYYKNIESAFLVYKKHKEQLIKELANKYKKQIPDKLYNAMINYEVEIDD